MNSLDKKMHVVASFLLFCIPIFLLFTRAAADISVVLIALIFLARSLLEKKWSWTREKDILILLIIFVLMNLVISPFAEHIGKSFERSLSWLRFVVFYAAVTRWILTDARTIKWFVTGLLFALGTAACDALYQFFTGFSLLTGQAMSGRLTGPLDRPNIGMYLSKLGFAALTMAVMLYAHGVSRKLFIIGCVLSPLLLVVVFLSGERAASVLTLLAIMTTLFSLFLIGGAARKVSLGLAFVGAIALILLLITSDRIWGRVEALASVVSDYSDSIYGQLVFLGIRFFAENPLTGSGMGNYPLVCKDYTAAGLTNVPCHPHPHNFYVEWLSDTGMIGTIPFTVFIGLLYFMGLKTLFGPRESRLLGGLYLGVLVMSLFPFSVTQSLFSNWPAILAWTSIASAVAALRFPASKVV
ncbi:O-antigen ligase [Thalassospira sp. MBR-102]|jgi:O-antigen ligase|uniref:Polymerase n=1 Tax=Thalassospira xiamenensis TaxID=220697 RepID=A0ABR5Y1L7_9PROT|nr:MULTISPECIES: O-antigen ligase family protein [Thalassospira]MBR9781808.1 O-antigen ligase family protein [Rhodospirillales bacterium]KZD01788.1 polymerase [Thalassospira xiamenensis]KZD11273.1 polymerase [Thalassospira xiamenensis]MAB32561.1 O-antigen ligase domain-containing protein [Thalassospira sp.]MBA06509.1 O-antigen ligase domain-containing protein [Thalassospira sp.]|tara:strand:- start:5817 stop:7052 length:1236 start_codon:yes stop_codon:yes gene_type:complete